MKTDINYSQMEHRQTGFDHYYQFHLESNDWSPDVAVDKWIADECEYDFEKRCVVALFYGACYNAPCEMIFADQFPVFTPAEVPRMVKFFTDNKSHLAFASDAKYRKMVFPKFLESVSMAIQNHSTLGNYIKAQLRSNDAETNYLSLQQACTTDWYHWGRMGHWCFAEALYWIADANIKPPAMEFGPGGKSHTSGWAFCTGQDHLLERIENLTKDEINSLEQTAKQYLQQFKAKHKHIDRRLLTYFTLETACCNYKRQHRGTRYGGCYIDEQYDELTLMAKDWPGYSWLRDLYLAGRQALIPTSLLYENSGSSSGKAHIKSVNKALQLYGRMPHVEAYFNKQPQLWTEINNMPFAKQGSDLIAMME